MNKMNFSGVEVHPSQVRKNDSFRRFLAGAATGLALLSIPLVERQALAQTPSAATTGAGTFRFECMREIRSKDKKEDKPLPKYMVTGGDKPAEVCAVYIDQENNVRPVLSVEGPAAVTLRFYPTRAVNKDDRNYTLRYSVDGVLKEEPGVFTSSNLKCADLVDDKTDVIGAPKDVTLQVGPGQHSLSVIFPNGLVELNMVGPMPIAPPPVAQPSPVQVKKDGTVSPANDNPAGQAVDNPSRPPLTSIRSPFELRFERDWLGNIGDNKNSASTNEFDALYRYRINSRLALMVGLHANLYQARLSTSMSNTDILSASGNALAGLAYTPGKHTLFVAGYAGILAMTPTITGTDGSISKHTDLGASYGGRLGYDYDDTAGFVAQLGNNPFLPGYLRGYVVSPWGWVKSAHPRLDLSFSMLHLLKPVEDGKLGSASLSEPDLLSRAVLKVPIYALGPVVPSVIAGGQVNHTFSSTGTTSPDAFFGGGLSVRLSRVYLEAGAASTLHGDPLVLFNLSVR